MPKERMPLDTGYDLPATDTTARATLFGEAFSISC